MKNIFKILLITFVFGYLICILAIPILFEMNKDFLSSSIQSEFGSNTNLANAKLRMCFVPVLLFQTDKIEIDNNLTVENPKIKINLIPLLFKKISIKSFSAENIRADLTLDKNKNLLIGKYVLKPIDNKFDLNIDNLNIYNYKIYLKDEFNGQKVFITGKRLLIHNNNILTNADLIINNNPANLNISLIIPDKNDYNNLSVEGTVTNLNLAEIFPYIQQSSKGKIENLSGMLNLQAKYESNKNFVNLNTQDFLIKVKGIEKPILLKDKATINTEFNILKNNLEIQKLSFKTNGINALLDGNIRALNSKFPKYDLNLEIKNSKAEAFLPIVPYITIPNFDVDFKKLKDYGIFAKINGKINIKGDNFEPSVFGNFTANELYLQKPLNIPKAILKLDFKGKKVYFDAFVPASKKEHVKVNGNVELYGKKIAEIDISSTQNVDLKIAQTILNPLHEILTFEIGPVPIMDIKGNGNIKLKVKGNKKEPHLWGNFNFKNGIVTFNDINAVIKNGSGKLDFNDEKMHFTTFNATLNNVPIKIQGDCTTKGNLNFNVTSNNQSLNETLKMINTSPMLKSYNIFTKNIVAASEKINLSLSLKGNLTHIKDFDFGKTIIPSGHIHFLNNKVLLLQPKIPVENILGDISFKNKDVDFNISSLLGEQRINFVGKIKNDKIYSNNKFNKFRLNFKDLNLIIDSGEFNINGDKILLKKLNANIDSKPVIIDGSISNIYNNPQLDLYVSSRVSQEFIDKFVNKFSIYPFIIKGDINYSARVTGNLDKINILGTINLNKNSSIYYKGAIIESSQNPIKLNIDTTISKQKITIRKFQYNILGENNKSIPLLNATGKIKLKDNDFIFDNFKIQTQKESDARIFNIIFKKPIIKEGLFSSNFTVNGNINYPSLFGTFNLYKINAPFLDSTIQDINVVFKNKTSDIVMKGDILSNKIILHANVNNSSKPPYVINKADLYLGNFDVNSFLRHLDKIIIEDIDKNSSKGELSDFNIRDLIIKHLDVKANSVYVRNLFATDVDATVSILNGLLSLEKLNFVTAEGTISGKLNYDFISSDMNLFLNFKNINANTISDALFEIKNQMFGDLSGETQLSCNGKTHNDCMKTLNGECKFTVSQGKMPKLGSLEYLLKSSNVLKSGITGLTINNLIQILIPPINNGEFDSIKGHFVIENGITDNINIASKGKDLSIFISGTYNFATAQSNFEVFGRLAKKISNELGAIGNISLNSILNTIPGVNLSKVNQTDFVQFINKIPGIELNTKDYRIFFVKIDGNLNTENFTKIFKWLD